MLVVHHNPGHVGVSRIQHFSEHCNLVHQLVSLSAVGTCVDGIPIHVVFAGTSLSLCNEISGVFFEADGKGERLGIEFIFFNSTSFDQIALALSGSMLAGEGPAAAVLGASCVTIGVEVELTYFPEILGVCCSFEGRSDESKAIRT